MSSHEETHGPNVRYEINGLPQTPIEKWDEAAADMVAVGEALQDAGDESLGIISELYREFMNDVMLDREQEDIKAQIGRLVIEALDSRFKYPGE